MADSLQTLLNRLRSTLVNFNFSEVESLYNPMEYFLNYVSHKEIVHSKILAELLNDNGVHGFGNVFIKNFFNKFLDEDYSSISSISVTSERKVSRVLTKGGKRSIDIFIDYCDNNGNKNAIIIENKLNDANYQPLQLEEYYKSIKSEGYDNIKLICIHEFWRPSDSIITLPEKQHPIILYPLDVAKWLQESLTIDDIIKESTLQSYITYLKNINAYNVMNENTEELLGLDQKSLSDVKVLAEAYNNLINERRPIIQKKLLEKWPDIIVVYHKGTKNIEIYNQKDYNRNGFWICIWKWQNFNSIYLCTENDENHDDEILISTEYVRDMSSTNYGYRWYNSRKEGLRDFPYPDKAYFEDMIQEINRLLEIMHNI